MLESVSEYKNQIQEIWNNLDRKAQIIIIISIVLVLGVLIFLITRGGTSNYQTLFSNLDSEDANAIVERLESQGIPYRLENGGNTIKVPSTQVYKSRLDMAGEGLPSRGVVGFEIFDQSQFGTTDFERKVNFYRALGGELSRSIRAMNSVEFARVQITAPKESIFEDRSSPPKASVLLELKRGINLSNSQVQAISNLVANGVQGLQPEQVSIVDTKGNLLTASLEEGENSNQSTMEKLEVQDRFEEGLKTDLRIMLSKVLGPDNFTVQVQAELNFDRREVESKLYSPVVDEEGIVRSEENIEESYTGPQAGAEGAPGTDSNIPQYNTEDGVEGGTGNYERNENVTNYEINEKIEKQVYSPGEIEDLSVSVIVNQDMDEEQIETIRNSVEAAIGFNPERDRIQVSSIPFDESLQEEMEAAKAAASAQETRRMYIYGGLIALISILLFGTIFILRRRREPEYVPGERVDMEVGEETGEEVTSEEELSEEEKRRQQMREKLEELVYEEPEDVAEILKSWLMEE